MAHSHVMDLLGCNDLGDIIDPAFLSEFNLVSPGQYGMVCRDVGAQVAALEARGAGPFIHAHTPGPNWTEWGERKEVQTELALGYSNGQQIELLGPGEGTNFYLEKIPDDGSIALHHVCVFQHRIFDIEQRLNAAGYPTCLSGHIGVNKLYTTRFKYFDTRDELGIYLEVCEYEMLGRHSPPGEGLIGAIGSLQKRFSR